MTENTLMLTPATLRRLGLGIGVSLILAGIGGARYAETEANITSGREIALWYDDFSLGERVPASRIMGLSIAAMAFGGFALGASAPRAAGTGHAPAIDAI